MRRLLILIYWLTKSRNNVGIGELIRFCFKPTVKKVAGKFIRQIVTEGEWRVITFTTIERKLYWPKKYSTDGIYQVVSETFDEADWHFYQKENTKVREGEVLVDVGAAEGLFSLTVVDRCKRIILIEPNSLFSGALGQTFDPMREKVSIFNGAVGDKEGEMTFDSESLEGRVGHGTGKVMVTTVDQLLEKEERITYLKADLEGFELSMLRGARNIISKHKPKIAITTYHIENDPTEIIAFVKGVVPEYKYYVKGIHQLEGKPVMIHFWI